MSTVKTSNQGERSYIAPVALGRYLGVANNASDQAILPATAGTRPLGITVDGTDAAGQPVAISIFGKGETKRLTMASTGAKDAEISIGTNGKGKTAAAGEYIVGRAAKAWAADEVIEIIDHAPVLKGAAAVASIADATASNTVNATFSNTEVKAILDAHAAKINLLIAAGVNAGIITAAG